MNYLGHFFLSGDSTDILVGNFIADSVKGKQYLNYSPEIAKGILLHRTIDSFTDQHPSVRQAIALFRPLYSRHSGVFVDVLYDYLLCKHWNEFSSQLLGEFIDQKMDMLASNYFKFPFKVQQFFPFMRMNGWIKRYQSLDGIDQVMIGMAKHTSFPAYNQEMKPLVLLNMNLLSSGFRLFLSEIIPVCEHFLQNTHQWDAKGANLPPLRF